MAATDGVALVALAPGDAPRALALSAEAGWNQIEADWRFMLESGAGIGAVDSGGALVASALVLPLGKSVSWVGMVLVAEARRRRGLGTRVLNWCIERIAESGATAGLDATEFGRPVYARLGFVNAWSFARWRVPRAPDAPMAALRPLVVGDLPVIAALDAAACGLARGEILAHLLARAPGRAWVAERVDGSLAGFALGRDGRLAPQVGPVVADDAATALALLARAADGESVVIDVPDAQGRFARALADAGAARLRGFVRMARGADFAAPAPSRVFAVAGPELG